MVTIDRMRELARLSGLTSELCFSGLMHWGTDEKLVKFAELIVQDVLTVLLEDRALDGVGTDREIVKHLSKALELYFNTLKERRK